MAFKGKTESGFEFELDDAIFDDYEFLEVLTAVDKGDLAMVPEMLNNMLGTEQTIELKNHIRSQDGRVSTSRMMDEIKDILRSNKDIKNS